MNGASPWWKRSIFGDFLKMAMVIGIYWLVDGEIPTSKDWIQLGTTLLLVFGYQGVRPTGPVPKP